MTSDVAFGCAIVGLLLGVGLVQAGRGIAWLYRRWKQRDSFIPAHKANEFKTGAFMSKEDDK